jgi:hypothetical protein
MASERARSAASSARWRAVYDERRRRHAAGEPIMRISRTLGVAHGTVRRFVRSPEFPGWAPHRRQPSILDLYVGHLHARHAAGCENSAQLFGELRALGYVVPRFAALLRNAGSGARPASGDLEQWLADARPSGVRAVETFAQGLT